MSKQPVVIIGSGLAGYMFAKEWRKLNAEQPLTIISRDDAHFYSKPLLSNALAKGKTAAELITTPVQTMREQLQADILAHTTVTAIDPENKTVTADDTIIEYDTLILATGAKPIDPPLSGDLSHLWQVNHLSDYTPFREVIDQSKSVAILGSGLIGCEFANDLLSSQHRVKLISIEQTPLIRLVPQPIGQRLQETFAEAGIEWHLGETAVSVQRSGNQTILSTQNGTQVSADCTLSAIGIRPDLSLAQAAGLTTNEGIVVNEWMQTSNRSIYALGDGAELNGRVELYIAPLLQAARTLAKNLAQPEAATPVKYPVMPVTIKTPLYPVVCASPLPGAEGEWHCAESGDSLIARFTDADGALRGFALGNGDGKLRMQLTKQLNHG